MGRMTPVFKAPHVCLISVSRLELIQDVCPDASEGDWVSLDLVRKPPVGLATINMIVDEETEAILSLAVVEVDMDGWVRCEYSA